MIEIKLYDNLGFGLIINLPTGVLISNQTGGNACLQPTTEGVFIPLANEITIDSNILISPETEFAEHFLIKYGETGATKGLDISDVEVLETILKKYNLHNFIRIDFDKLSQSHEAWIWVLINTDSENNLLIKNFSASKLSGVITWRNSD